MKYMTGQVVKGVVTGIQAYGAFVSLDDKTSGLIHISEISEGFVRDVSHFFKIGDVVEVKIIDFDLKQHQARLSLKALHPSGIRRERKVISRTQRQRIKETPLGFESLRNSLGGMIEDAMTRINKEGKL